MLALTLNSTLNTPLYQGAGTSNLVPLPYQVAINGRPYMVDLEFQPWKRQAFRTTSIAQTRTQADTSGEPGEATLNPEALWRRAQDTWTHGAGQTNLDRKESDIAMFRASKGVDPWSLWQLTLQKSCAQQRVSTNTNLGLAVSGGYLYVADGQTLVSTQATAHNGNPTWTTTTGTPAAAISSIASDGYNVYTAHGASGLYQTPRGGAATQLVSSALDPGAVVGYVLGRLMVGNLNNLYNIISTSVAALPGTPLLAQRNTDFKWVGFAEGPSFIYAAGYSGDKSLIYSIGITSDASALSAPTVAGTLPSGEIIRAIYGYAGFLIIGSDLGFRIAEIGSSGALTVGPLIKTPNPVYGFVGHDRFVWFTMTNVDATSTGLGRMDLSQFPVANLAPAWASDLMAGDGVVTVQGVVSSVVFFEGAPAFTVQAGGVWAQDPNNLYVASGWYQSGEITYDIADKKIPVFLDLTFSPLVGNVNAAVALNGGSFTSLGGASTAGNTFIELQASQTLCDWAEFQVTLQTPANNAAVTPTLKRATLRSIPAALTGSDIYVPIRMSTSETVGDTNVPMDPVAEWQILENLRQTHQIVTYQEGSKTLTVYVSDIDWIPEQVGPDGKSFAGPCVVTLKTVV